MSEIILPYKSPFTVELEQKYASETGLPINPWTVQNIVYELITNYFLSNPPNSVGIPLKLAYSADKAVSDINVEIAYKHDPATANKRPAVFIRRGDVTLAGKTFGNAIGRPNVMESESNRLILNAMPVTVSVIAKPIAMVELMAEYTKQPLLYFQQEIQSQFKFRKFRVVEISKPQIYVEAQDYFVIMINIEVDYDEGWIIQSEDLKLKTVSRFIFESLTQKLLTI